jgi:hypothetical protein
MAGGHLGNDILEELKGDASSRLSANVHVEKDLGIRPAAHEADSARSRHADWAAGGHSGTHAHKSSLGCHTQHCESRRMKILWQSIHGRETKNSPKLS